MRNIEHGVHEYIYNNCVTDCVCSVRGNTHVRVQYVATAIAHMKGLISLRTVNILPISFNALRTRLSLSLPMLWDNSTSVM